LPRIIRPAVKAWKVIFDALCAVRTRASVSFVTLTLHHWSVT
jgi:hypothetical protein